MGRTSRTAPLPDVPRATVPDPSTQRIVTAIVTSLQAVLKFLKPYAEPEPWRQVDYYGDWVDNANATLPTVYRKDAFGGVRLRGWVSSAAGNQSVICVLPVGYRPLTRIRVPASWYTGAAYATIQLDVDVDGRVLIASPAMPGAAVEVFLDHVHFETEA